MNKIYRVVWNETTQAWNAVAEFAKAHGKTASSGIGGIVASAGVRFAFTAIMSGLLLASGQAMATDNSYLLNLGNNVKNALGGKTAIDGEGNLTLNDLGGTGKANVHDALEAMNNKINQLGGGLGGGSSSHFYSVQTPSNDRGNYNNNGATGLDALAAGADAQAAGAFAVAVGTGAQAAISNSIAIGKNATVNEDTASDMAVNGLTKGEGSVAIGSNTKASGTNATAVGQSSNAYGQNSLAAGQSSNAVGKSSVALGDGANATQDSATALGPYSQSTAAGATALGFNTRATAFGTVATGRNSKAVANNAVAMGNEADAQKEDTIAIGYNAQATQNRAVAFGKNAKATAGDTVAFGDAAKASVGNAIAFGKNANAAHADSIALGANSATEAAVQTTSATVGSLTFGNFAGNTPESTLSIGSAGKERTITNVAAGRISDSSTDAINGSQLYATQNVMNNIGTTAVGVLGGDAAIANDGTITMTNIGDTGKDNVHDAIKSVKETAEKGWNLKANDETSSEKIAAGDTVTVKQGKNIRVKRSGKELTVETSDDVEFGTVSATTVLADSFISGNSVLSGEGLKIGADGSPSQVSLTNAGLNNGGNKIVNVAKGTEDNDAVNVAQLNEQLAATEKTTTVVAGKNVTVSEKVDGNNTEYTVNADKTTLSQAANGAVKVSEGAKDADGVTDYALDLTDEAKADIAKGVAAKDAVDNKGLTFAADNGTTGTKKLGDSLSVKGDGNILTRADENGIGFSLADKITVGKAGNGNKPLVIDGTAGLISGLSNTTLGGADFATKGQAASEEQLNAAQANLAKVLGGNAANDKGNVTTTDIGGTGKDNVHDAIKSVKETAEKGWNLKANDETSSEKIAAGDTVTVKQGKNIRVKRSGKELTVETSDDVEFGTVSATTVLADSFISGNSVLSGEGLKIGADGSPSQVSLTNAGLNNGGNKIVNVAKGTEDNDAVNVAQLNEQLAATEKTTTVVAGKNVTVSEKVDGNNTEYTVNADKTTLSQAANGAVKVSEGAKDADGVTDYALDLTDEAKADIAKGVAAKDAVDNKGLTFAADNGTTGTKKLGDSLSVKGDGNILTRADENGIGFSLADKITVGKAGNGNKPLVIDGTAGLISGLSNTTLGGADFATKGQAASEEQLNAAQANLAKILGGNAANNKGNVTTTDIGGTGKDNVHDAIAAVKETADKGWNLNANDETSSEKIGAGDTVTFKEGKNVKVSRNGKNITVATSDDVSFDKVTVGDSVLTDNGLTVGNGKAGKPVSLTKDGLNNGGNKIANVAAGEADTDAVNVAQLKAAAAKATSKVDSGNDNIVVTPEQNADGSTTYKVATAPNLKADSFTAGDTVVNNDGVKVGDKVALGKDGLKAGDVNITADGINAGNKAISNVAEGKKDTDAVNVAQLKAAAAKATSKVESGNDNIVVTPKQNADGSTTYTVATAPNLKADSFTAGDTVVNNDGVKVGDKVALGKDGLKAGDVNITAHGINAGNKAISNVAEGKKDTDAVNVGQLNRLTAAAKTEVEAGTNIASVSSKQGANGQTVYTVNADGASVSAGSDNIVVTKGNKDANNVTDYAVDLSKAVKADIAKGVAAKDAVDNKGISFAGDSGTTVANKLGDTVAVKGDANITTTAGANGIQVGLNKDLKVDSVKAGDTVVNNSGVNVGDKVVLGKDGLKAGDVNITAEGINAGGKKVTNVAAGTVAADSTDAVNGSQLYQANQAINQRVTNLGNYVVNMGNQINQRIDNVESDSKAGTAAAMAVAGLPQAYLPGKSMMAVAGGVYRGESGYAVGFSSISDGGNWVIKGTATGNSRGHYGATAGVGYQW